MNQYGPDFTDDELADLARSCDHAGRATVLSLIEQLRKERSARAALAGILVDQKQEIADLYADVRSLETELFEQDEQTRTIQEQEAEIDSLTAELRDLGESVRDGSLWYT